MRGSLWKTRWLVPAVALALVVVACGPPPVQEGAEPAAGEGTQLDFVVWSYSIETIQDNIAQFEQLSPGVQVSLEDHSWFDYHDIMATKFTGGNPPEVQYSSDHWLQEWVAAGWLAPLNEHCPDLAQYQGEWAPYATQGMTLDGNLYGLPYYADLLIFMYNDAKVQEAGLGGAPVDWDAVAEQASALKEQGISEFPVAIPLKKDDPWMIEIFYSMVYSRGGAMFDGLTPVFAEPGGAAEQTLQWLHDALNESRILDPAAMEVAEPDVVKTMGAGQHIYTVLAKYNLAELNQGQHEEKGNFKMALMPGDSHSTVGFVRFYALSQATVDQGEETVTAACDFLNYFGGKTDGEYKVPKRWALEKGLGFANLPLYEDPEVAEAINAWGDVELEREQAELARVKEGLAPWWGAWDIFARAQIHDAVLGQVPVQKALQSMEARWEEFRQQHEG
ncbi:MAG: ABC transporter substrate-binding protein [Acidimicrobiia bacterium]